MLIRMHALFVVPLASPLDCSTLRSASDSLCISATQAPHKPPTCNLPEYKLVVAPMEVLGDFRLRHALSALGGMSDFVTEFLRVRDIPDSTQYAAHSKALAKKYSCTETTPFRITPQLMGSDANAMADAAVHLVNSSNAHRIDINCGCPAKRVNNRGAGAALLLSSNEIHQLLSSIHRALRINCNKHTQLSVKMRTGFHDTSQFESLLSSIVHSGVSSIAIHARTSVQKYNGDSNWQLLQHARQYVPDNITIVGNGDIISADDALRMFFTTQVDGVMIGRGAVIDPHLFSEIEYLIMNGILENTRYNELYNYHKNSVSLSDRKQRGFDIATLMSSREKKLKWEQQCEMNAMFRSEYRIRLFWTKYYDSCGMLRDPSRVDDAQCVHKLKSIVSFYFSPTTTTTTEVDSMRSNFRHRLLRFNARNSMEYLDEIVQCAVLLNRSQTALHFQSQFH
mmetsp:Transcript_1883/g.3353  ORF Transcript_1883/g.3353 Transcript_1883/m.3353 type:complete len:452 (-) Transcript_1883:1076-2431(-)